MTARWLPSDDAFFHPEWRDMKAQGAKRDLRRAVALARALDVDIASTPVITVVGSKGKGTTAAACATALEAAGLRVGLVTSPAFRTNCERIRLNGESISEVNYDRLAERVRQAHATLAAPQRGYLSPTGSYTIAALAYLNGHDVDVVVVEEGMGGTSDEVSLLSPSVVAVTPLFGEHKGVLGETDADVFIDLLGVVGPCTRTIVAAPQRSDQARRLIANRARCVGAAQWGIEEEAIEAARVSWGDPIAANVATGVVAALAYLKEGRGATDVVARIAPSLRLPGRQSFYRRQGHTVFVDAAIDGWGMREALARCEALVGTPDHVLVALPDGKDIEGCREELAGRPVEWVRAGVNLRYSQTEAAHSGNGHLKQLLDVDTVDTIACCGTISWVAEVLDILDVDCQRAHAKISPFVERASDHCHPVCDAL